MGQPDVDDAPLRPGLWPQWRLLAGAAAIWLACSCSDDGVAPPSVTGSIAGTVSAEGDGLPDVTVTLDDGATATTDAAGTYRFESVPAGSHGVWISGHPDDVEFASLAGTATVSSSGQTVTLDFEGTYVRTSFIAGVVSVQGIGAPDIAVTLSGPDESATTTDAAGAYGFGSVRAGSYAVRISGFDSAAVGFDATSQEIEVGVEDSAMANFDGVSLAAEKTALIDLYEATGGSQWGAELGWSPEAPLSGWEGVETDSAGAVTALILSGVGMTGQIPTTLGSSLTRLDSLIMSKNDLTGSIPIELWIPPRLQVIDLSDNQLTGEIPADFAATTDALWTQQECLPAHKKLRRIDLSGNLLQKTIPAGIGCHSNLKYLGLSHNELTGTIPAEIGSLSNLEYLRISHNLLTGVIPPEMGSLSQLAYLDLSHNRLTGEVPSDLTNITGIQVFRWDGNAALCAPLDSAFQAWLATVGDRSGPNCRSERDILVALYHATDGPNWRDNTNWLTDAPLGEWYGVIVDAGGRVVGLDLRNAGLTGPIPPVLAKLSGLEALWLKGHRLRGPIPPQLGNLSRLKTLYLDGDLSGPIPPELGNLSRLEELILDVSGPSPIPPQLGNLSRLKYLYVNWWGPIPIPPELGNLSRLERLRVYGKQRPIDDIPRLTAPIPPELGNLSRLKELELLGIALTGPIPPELGNLSRLEDLRLNNNALTGPIPPELGNLSRLEHLHLAYNFLTGPIPPELGNLSRLEDLILSRNALTGPIPDSFLRIRGLFHFHIRDNESLCVPNIAAFVQWLLSIAFKSWAWCVGGSTAAGTRLTDIDSDDESPLWFPRRLQNRFRRRSPQHGFRHLRIVDHESAVAPL